MHKAVYGSHFLYSAGVDIDSLLHNLILLLILPMEKLVCIAVIIHLSIHHIVTTTRHYFHLLNDNLSTIYTATITKLTINN